MNNTTLQLKIKQRLNKLDSQDYDNFECWQIVEAFNKGQIEWVRRQIQGVNIAKAGDEQSRMRISDLQILLKEESLIMDPFDRYYQSETLPSDFMYFKRVNIHARKDCCETKNDMTATYLAEEENIALLLGDDLKKPSFEWGETFCTFVGNRLRVYTNNDFEVSKAILMYYRLPTNIQIAGCVDPYTLAPSTNDVECQFKDDIAEILVDEAVQILAGDIESITQYQIAQSTSQTNT
jgi:hypothetical protein